MASWLSAVFLLIEGTSQSPRDGLRAPTEVSAVALAICTGVRAMKLLLGEPGLPLRRGV